MAVPSSEKDNGIDTALAKDLSQGSIGGDQDGLQCHAQLLGSCCVIIESRKVRIRPRPQKAAPSAVRAVPRRDTGSRPPAGIRPGQGTGADGELGPGAHQNYRCHRTNPKYHNER